MGKQVLTKVKFGFVLFVMTDGGEYMLIIQTLHDLERIKQESLLPSWYLEHLHEFFVVFFTALHREQTLDTFSLEGKSEFIILEAKDNLQKLTLPMLPGNARLMELNPEYVGKLKVNDKELYRIMFMLDNERIIFVFSEVGQFADEVEQWFMRQLEWSELNGDV